MKRLTLLTILLVVVGLASGFALEVKPSFTLAGSGTVTWGIDLQSYSTGFLNAYTADLTVNLIAADGTDTHKGTGDWYGEITISNVELYATDGVWALIGDATVAAKIVGLGGALAIGVYPAPDLALDWVAAIENADVDDTVVDIETDLGVDYPLYGTYFSYTLSEAFMVGLEVVSENDWTLNAANAYAFAVDVQAKFTPLTINAGVSKGFNYASNPFGLGLKVAADTTIVDAWVGFDGSLDGSVFAYEVGAGATFTFLQTVTAAFSVVFDDPLFNNLDLKFVLTEPAAAGLVDKMDASLTVYLLDIGGAIGLEYEVIFTAGYDTGKLYPHFGLTYGDAANPVDDAAFLSAFVHVNYDLFEAAPTLLFIEWNGVYILPAFDPGILTVGVTVTY